MKGASRKTAYRNGRQGCVKLAGPEQRVVGRVPLISRLAATLMRGISRWRFVPSVFDRQQGLRGREAVCLWAVEVRRD